MIMIMVQFEDSVDISQLGNTQITVSDGVNIITGGTIFGLITKISNPINLAQLRITQIA